MATPSSGAAYKNASFIYFWLGLLTGALIIILTMILQSAFRSGQASLFDAYSINSITSPQTLNAITSPQTTTSITSPQTLNAITSPQTRTSITSPQTLTR